LDGRLYGFVLMGFIFLQLDSSSEIKDFKRSGAYALTEKEMVNIQIDSNFSGSCCTQGSHVVDV
jgi:hypothetical protein